MTIPPVATLAACGSLITAVKSGWELTRMFKKKDMERRLDKDASGVLRGLQNCYLDGLMSERSFEKWYDRFLAALAEKDCVEMHKVRKHIELLRTVKDRVTRDNTRANRNSHYDDKHEHVSYRQRRPHSVDRRNSYTEYSRYDEKHRRPSHNHGSHHNPNMHLDTGKAQREYYYSHALPSPYKGEIEYTPLSGEFEEDRRSEARKSHGHSGAAERAEYQSRSTSTHDRGRTRSRSVHQERRVRDSSADAESETEETYERREYYPKGGHGARSVRH